jgi:hypothetical protein
VKVNYQPTAAPTAEGYIIDPGWSYGTHGTESYGWR